MDSNFRVGSYCHGGFYCCATSNNWKLNSLKKMINKEQEKGGFWFIKILMFVGLILLAYVSYCAFKVVYKKNQIQNEILGLQEEAKKIEKNNNDLRDKISYFESRDFQEKEVKDKLSLQQPDESLVIVKPGPAKEKQAEKAEETQEMKDVENVPTYKKWWDYFFKY